MFKHLLVPLDGSRMGEAALPAAAFFADRLQAHVTLVHIVERNPPSEVHGERHLTDEAGARAYLDEVRRREFPASATVETHVHTTEVADVTAGIVDHVEELRPDLIVMCTHGHGGIRGLLFGSIAQQVVSRGTVPVLLIRPEAKGFQCRRLLVPVDISGEHESGLTVGAELADACAAELELVLVVPTIGTLSGGEAAAGRLMPRATQAMLDMACHDARGFLCDKVEELRQRGLQAGGSVDRGDPVQTIAAAARDKAVDLVVLATHGKAGMNAFWSGSVAAKLSNQVQLPLLLVPEKQRE